MARPADGEGELACTASDRVRLASPSPPSEAAEKDGRAPDSPRVRTAAGATKSAVLEALAGGQAMTAGEVAAKAGLGRATVSTTLSKLAKSGEVQKAQRGYRLAPTARPPSSPAK